MNGDIPVNKTIYYYLSGGKTHVFVFNEPIPVGNNQFSGTSVSNLLKGPAAGDTKAKIVSNTKVEDEIVCDYSEDSDKPPAEDKSATTVATSFGMLLLNIMLLVLFLHFFQNYKDKILANDNLHVFLIFSLFVVWVVFIGVFAWATSKKMTNYTIGFGSLLVSFTFIFALIFSPNSDFAKFFAKTPVIIGATTTTPPKPHINSFSFMKF